MKVTKRKAKRGRPAQFERSDAVRKATELFWRQGYEGTSMPEISAITGLSPSSIYNEFGSKRELFLTALDLYLGVWIEGMLGPLEHGTEGLTDLDAFLKRLATNSDAGLPPGCLAVNTIAEFGDQAASVATRTARYRAILRRSLNAALHRAANRGEISRQGLADKVEALSGIVLSLNLLLAAGAPSEETRRLSRAALALARS